MQPGLERFADRLVAGMSDANGVQSREKKEGSLTRTLPAFSPKPGFAFTFSSGVDITGVKVDNASATDFRPTGSGLQLVTPTDILVNVAGDVPNTGDKLILDVTTFSRAIPEPASLLLLGSALLGVAVTRRGRVRRPDMQDLGQRGEHA